MQGTGEEKKNSKKEWERENNTSPPLPIFHTDGGLKHISMQHSVLQFQ